MSKKNAAVIKHPQLVARLRREREHYNNEAHAQGLDFGREWAVNTADEREIRVLVDFEWNGVECDVLDMLMQRAPSLSEAVQDAAEDDDWRRLVEKPSEYAFVEGLLQAVRQVWSEVKHQL